jgi:hypothetical protein
MNGKYFSRKRTRHFGKKFIIELIKRKEVKVEYCPRENDWRLHDKTTEQNEVHCLLKEDNELLIQLVSRSVSEIQ